MTYEALFAKVTNDAVEANDAEVTDPCKNEAVVANEALVTDPCKKEAVKANELVLASCANEAEVTEPP